MSNWASGLLAMIAMAMPAHCDTVADSSAIIDEVFAHLPFEKADLEKLLKGDIVAYDLEPGGDKEVAIAVAMLVRAPIGELVDFVLRGQVFRVNKTVIDVHLFGDRPASEDLFSGAGFTADESNEVVELMHAEPGSHFNLSRNEIARLEAVVQRLGSAPSVDSPDVRNAVNDAYRTILVERYRDYRRGGLEAMAPYERASSRVDTGKELREMIGRMSFIRDTLPAFYRALVDYPENSEAGIHNQFALVKLNANDRPAYVLSRRMYRIEPGQKALVAYQEFYVGHSYNSLQIVAAVIRIDQGTLVFYANRTSTDLVAGFGGPLKRSMGRRIMRDNVSAHFEAIRRSVE